MDAEVKNEEVTDDSQIPILIEPKQENNELLELIESKVELVDEIDVKKEEIDDSEYQHMIPHEYRDYLEQNTEEEQLTNSRKRPANDSSIPEKIGCLKCGNSISLTGKSNVITHALRHAGIMMYECPAKQCSYKSYASYNVTYHMKRMHKSCTDPVRTNEMSDQDKQKVKDTIDECFPTLRHIKHHASTTVICQLCHRDVKNERKIKRKHSIEHIDPRLFKCEDCLYFTNYFDSLSNHIHLEHQKVFDPIDKDRQLKKQEIEFQKWNDKCFSNKDVNLVESVDYPAPVAKKPVPIGHDDYICRICHKEVVEVGFLSKIGRQKHAAEHVIYKCRVPDCQFQTKYQKPMIDHEVKIHRLFGSRTDEDRQVLKDMIQECFPALAKTGKIIESKYPARNINCQLCHRSVEDLNQEKREHSIWHIDPKLFNCEEQYCNFSTNWSQCFINHGYFKHRKTFIENDRKRLLMKEKAKMQQWDDMCFSMKNPNHDLEQEGYTCQVCKKIITEDGCDTNRRIHASEHMDIMLCSVPNCQFQTKYLVAMNNHQLTVHVSEPASSSGTSFRFKTAQEWGIERMLGRCFPELIKK